MVRGKLHVISTGTQKPQQLVEIIGQIHPFIDAIHIREKSKTAKEVYEIVMLLINRNIPLSKIIINDRIDVAYALKAQGVQLAYHSLPADVVKKQFESLRVGCSVHSVDDAQLAQQQGADYVILGHIFTTNSKPGLAPKGLELLQVVSHSVTIPVLAIGGIKPANVRDVLDAGAKGIAVMSGIMDAKDPLKAVNEYAQQLTL
ncbi:thiazole tautomerase TenI [Paenisporosarcina sp. TG20]|uniref:thiazole tautomerase TenI n=1 Tax=Paenisporosarcina sp. TG20 TaxID=1211706 RepID=UPI0002E6BCD0|nr:thiazole tautomerase TenI [Paenisporosarcina sp. TG20]